MSKVQRFWCDEARNIRCVREDDFDTLEAEAQALREEVAALRARVAVVPERKDQRCESDYLSYSDGWNACLAELARLNGKAVSEGLLRKILSGEECSKEAEELRALLGEGKEP